MSSDETEHRQHISTENQQYYISQGSRTAPVAAVTAIEPKTSYSSERLNPMPHIIIPATDSSHSVPALPVLMAAFTSSSHNGLHNQQLQQQALGGSSFSSPDSGVTDMSGDGIDKLNAAQSSSAPNGSGERQAFHMYNNDQPQTITLMPGDSLDVKSGNIRRTITGKLLYTSV